MFRFTMWRIRRALNNHEPGFKVTLSNGSSKRIKAEIKPDGSKQFAIHKVGTAGDKKVWYYTVYQLEADGKTATPIRNGKYPYEFTKT